MAEAFVALQLLGIAKDVSQSTGHLNVAFAEADWNTSKSLSR